MWIIENNQLNEYNNVGEVLRSFPYQLTQPPLSLGDVQEACRQVDAGYTNRTVHLSDLAEDPYVQGQPDS